MINAVLLVMVAAKGVSEEETIFGIMWHFTLQGFAKQYQNPEIDPILATEPVQFVVPWSTQEVSTSTVNELQNFACIKAEGVARLKVLIFKSATVLLLLILLLLLLLLLPPPWIKPIFFTIFLSLIYKALFYYFTSASVIYFIHSRSIFCQNYWQYW